jgi:Bax protein
VWFSIPEQPVEIAEVPEDERPEELPPPLLIPDFAAIDDIEERKATFFNYLTPYIVALNDEMLELREQVELMSARAVAGSLTEEDRVEIRRLVEIYEVPDDNSFSDYYHLQMLLERIDVIPISLVLAQAANESAWGTSRFTKEGLNFFGEWCYDDGCGIVPERRRMGATHEVQAFASVEASVRSYFMNLNTFPAYDEFRELRESLRHSGLVIDGITLSAGLDSYSERGEHYIEELQSIIYYNDLHELDYLAISG